MSQAVHDNTPTYVTATTLTIGTVTLLGIPLAIAQHYNSDYQYYVIWLVPFIYTGYVVAVMNLLVFSKRLRKKTVKRKTALILMTISGLYLGLGIGTIVTNF